MTSSNQNPEPQDAASHPLTRLPREDLDLIVELVLQSGSLKGLADAYSVSYPTIRARLDKTMDRLRAVLIGHTLDPISTLMADLVDRRELSAAGARRLRDAIRQQARNTEGG